MGAEGLEVHDGEQLLVADDAAGFAKRCAELLTDETLRASLAEAAHRHWTERITADALERRRGRGHRDGRRARESLPDPCDALTGRVTIGEPGRGDQIGSRRL